VIIMVDIQLVKAPCKETGMPEDRWYTPMNLLWLGTYLEEQGYKVEILDGQHLSTEQIKEKLNAPFVGISFDILSTASFEEIVEDAKRKESVVVVGGQAATPLAEVLLRKNPNIDFVVRYDGEESLRQIVEERKPRIIHNLTYRRKGQIVSNPDVEVDLTTLPIPDRSLINLEDYIQDFQRIKEAQNLPLSYNRPTNTYTKKGCPIRINGHGCSWCSRVDKRFREKTPQQFFDELRYLSEEFGIDHVSEFADDFLRNRNDGWVGELEKIMEKSPLSMGIRIYTSVRNISEINVKRLKRIGVDTILLGIESGNDLILRQNGKHQTRKQVIEACELLRNYKISVSPAYILGLIGETWDSIQDTISLSEQVSDICQTEISYWNPLTPLPGSNAWNILVQNEEFRTQFGDEYRLDPIELQKQHLQNNTQLGIDDYERLLEIRELRVSKATIASKEYVPIKPQIL